MIGIRQHAELVALLAIFGETGIFDRHAGAQKGRPVDDLNDETSQVVWSFVRKSQSQNYGAERTGRCRMLGGS
jgi:hypothetical protein